MVRRIACPLIAALFLTALRATSVSGDTGTQCNADAMLVFDASGSMAAMGYNGLSQPRINEARDALRRVLPQIASYRRLGLIVYGPGVNDACSNIDLRLMPIPDAASRIITEVDQVIPDGDTPLTQAVQEAAEILRAHEQPGSIVLVTDGRETCGGSTCQLAAELAASGAGITVHVIGFKVRSASFQWQGSGRWEGENGAESAPTVARCLADRTGGLYVPAESTEELVRALQETLGCPVVGMLPR